MKKWFNQNKKKLARVLRYLNTIGYVALMAVYWQLYSIGKAFLALPILWTICAVLAVGLDLFCIWVSCPEAD